MPCLHGKFPGPGVFVVCQPEDPDSVALLLDTSAAIHVAGTLWRTASRFSDTTWTVPGLGRDVNSDILDEYANSVEPPITLIRCPPGTRSPNLAERGQKKIPMLCNLNLHYGQLSLKWWEDMLLAAEG